MFVYAKENGTLKQYTLTGGETIPQSAVWIDLLNVMPEEKASVEQFLGIGIPTHEEMHEIEVSSRLYQEGGGSLHDCHPGHQRKDAGA
jgi:Mg2+ and Co2+ transporter CorA